MLTTVEGPYSKLFRGLSDRDVLVLIDADPVTVIFKSEIEKIRLAASEKSRVKIQSLSESLQDSAWSDWKGKVIFVVSGFLQKGNRHAYMTDLAKKNVVIFLPVLGSFYLRNISLRLIDRCSLGSKSRLTDNQQIQCHVLRNPFEPPIPFSPNGRSAVPLLLRDGANVDDIVNLVQGKLEGVTDEGFLLPADGFPVPSALTETPSDNDPVTRAFSLVGQEPQRILISLFAFPTVTIDDIFRLFPGTEESWIFEVVVASKLFRLKKGESPWSGQTQLELTDVARRGLADRIMSYDYAKYLGFAAAKDLHLSRVRPGLEDIIVNPEKHPQSLDLLDPDPEVRKFAEIVYGVCRRFGLATSYPLLGALRNVPQE
jgi:hypothetical protein